MIPIITLIGRTNVGKSSFFNLLSESNTALVNCIPGTTRDRNYDFFYINKKKFCLIDTAGIENFFKKNKKSNELNVKIYKQTMLAIEDANFIFFITDAKIGITNTDYLILSEIRKKNKKIFLLINKIDILKNPDNLIDFYELGIDNIYKISILHRIGIFDFLKEFYKISKKILSSQENQIKKNKDFIFSSDTKIKKTGNININICIIGKPNVGKSSLINNILNEDRMIVHNSDNTTRGINKVIVRDKKKKYILTDTGGLRRKTKKNNFLEHISKIKVINEIKKNHISVIVIDGSQSICSQDLFILKKVHTIGKSFFIIINKWDLIHKKQKKKVKENILKRLSFIKNYKIFFISSFLKTGLKNFFNTIDSIYDSSIKIFSPSYLTELISLAIRKHPIPMGATGKAIRLKYAHLGGRHPFLIVIHGTQTQFLNISYKKYLINFLQKTLHIPSTPIRLFFKNSYNPYNIKK